MTERWLDEVEMRAWVAFLDTSNLLLQRINQQLRDDGGLTQPQYELLTRLAETPDRRMRMAELADALVASRSGLTYQVSQLEKAGLVRRETCTSDDRGILAVLTPQGEQALLKAAPGHLRVVRENLIDLLDRDQLVALADTLSQARAHLRSAGNG
ncbi:DNA-binding MarR family transcriptional regulator [Actinoplanes octamycinicus]|uniref:DNA-binding MarR family transcriptional regulator n=1 Tax=Actinoplanes octamycinicus TaxID=135948 RepID=A0A7W7H1L9_9ACTN|nr:MarR family transcriptional regulator [Actinoplanes octamycinicus]MBB4742325.1 DNA-binding MarR family transcriptional regulator [Actinoplanes octamycinicus]GIE62426.1 MarR family transcriptional regulator [Actinoplanes octamycinicus]